MKWILAIALIFLFSACTSTARYKAIKNSRQNPNKSQKRNHFKKQIYSRNNAELQNYIHNWIGVPYKYGGMSKKGIDCSGFTSTVFKDIYDYKLPRTALDQYKSGQKVRTGQFTEGDLVFFRGVRGAGIDHVGVYLEDGKFVHASTSIGVTISDLSEEYYKTRFVGACRY
jgi:cell wall-associated NlpC family hydrolase